MKKIEIEIVSNKCPICGKIFYIEEDKKDSNEYYERGWCEECVSAIENATNPFADIDFLSM